LNECGPLNDAPSDILDRKSNCDSNIGDLTVIRENDRNTDFTRWRVDPGGAQRL